MTARDYFEAARRVRSDDQLHTAAGYYTSSAYGHLMQFRTLETTTTGDLSPKHMGYFARNLLLGALCYRIAGETHRSRATCEIGVRIIEDVKENERAFRRPKTKPPIGLCYELIGDFRLIGKIDSSDESYEKAQRYYETVENPRQWAVEPEFEIQMIAFLELADGTDYDVPDAKRGIIRTQSLVERIEYKRENFEKIIESVCEEGNWNSSII